jgi:ATP-dependent protease ClpP protease subunit
MTQPNFNIVMLAKGKARVEIYDVIGPSWAGMIDTKLVAQHLKDAGELSDIEVRINSPGGSAFDGLAIHNILKDHPAKVTVVIDGVAASAASLIAMAGDTIRIPKNAMMMIHEASGYVFGNKAELSKAIDMLDGVNRAGVATYVAKSKQSAEKVAQWMNDETWFTGQEAVDAGLADTTEADESELFIA